MIEFEVKLRAIHSDVEEHLLQLGATRQRQDFNNDQYFNHPNRDFAETDEALRIRQHDNGWKITYKGPKFDERSKSREEIEVGVTDESMSDILNRLGFVASGRVNKQRIYWELNGQTITLDKVEGLGEFVEIEIEGDDDSDREKMVAQLYSTVRQLGLDPEMQIPQSYLELAIDAGII